MEDILKEDSSVNQSFNSVFSQFGESIILADTGKSNKAASITNEYASYMHKNYGKEGVNKLNTLLSELENTNTSVDDYPIKAQEIEDVDINNASEAIETMTLFFDESIHSDNKSTISNSKSMDNLIQQKLKEASMNFVENSVKNETYNREEHKQVMLATFDEIIDYIENDDSILPSEKTGLILSMELNKENIDYAIPHENFNLSLSSKGFFKKLFKAVAKVVATVVIVAVTVAATVLTAGVVGVLDEPRSTDQYASGAAIGFGGLYLMGNLLNGTYKWIDKW